MDLDLSCESYFDTIIYLIIFIARPTLQNCRFPSIAFLLNYAWVFDQLGFAVVCLPILGYLIILLSAFIKFIFPFVFGLFNNIQLFRCIWSLRAMIYLQLAFTLSWPLSPIFSWWTMACIWIDFFLCRCCFFFAHLSLLQFRATFSPFLSHSPTL